MVYTTGWAFDRFATTVSFLQNLAEDSSNMDGECSQLVFGTEWILLSSGQLLRPHQRDKLTIKHLPLILADTPIWLLDR
jgi:hypothetical protein